MRGPIGSAWCRAFALTTTIWLAGGCSSELRDSRPSIVLVVIDTLRADAVSAYGAVEDTTPAFDALAAQGILYERAYAPSPWTLPSHASLFTGLGVDGHGVGIGGRMGLRSEFTTLADRLGEAGYQTVGFSENPLVSELFGFDRGFEWYSALPVEDAINDGVRPGDPSFDVVHEVAVFAAERDRNRPFFLFVNLFDPHSPYQNRDPNRFVDPGVSVGSVWTADALKASPNRICDRLPSSSELKLLHGLYLGDVAAADAKLGEIVSIAREAAGRDPVIVVATADHGEHFGEHRLLDHEFSVRSPVLDIPLVVQGLSGEPTGRLEAPVTLMDLAASILSWARTPVPQEAAGRPMPTRGSDSARSDADLLAVYSDAKLRVPEDWGADLKPTEEARDLKRSGCGPEDRVFGNMTALIRWPFKLIWFQRYPAELYDLRWDPRERSDLAKLRPEISGPLIEEARRRAGEIGLLEASTPTESPSAAELEALRGLGYVE